MNLNNLTESDFTNFNKAYKRSLKPNIFVEQISLILWVVFVGDLITHLLTLSLCSLNSIKH